MEPKPEPPSLRQLALFEGFFVEDKDQSRTLDLYDALPKFSLSWDRRAAGEENLREFTNVKVDGQVLKVTISAAVLSTKKEPGAKDAGGAIKGKVIFPGVREELVERALRKMAVQRQVEASVEDDPKEGWMIPFSFTLSQLRAELKAAGHPFTLAQLREALDVLGRAMLTIEGLEDHKISGFSHPLMLIAFQRRQGDRTGECSYYRAVFHPLATRAILGGAWQPINYTRVMRLGLPLARWIATRMNNRFRMAQKGAAIQGVGYYLTLSRILAESGLTPEKRLRNTIDRVREALKELRAEGFLDCMKAYDEEITYERTKGRSRIQDVKWTLYPSNRFVEEIIQGNVEVRRLKSGSGEPPGLMEGVGRAKGFRGRV